MAFPAYQFMDIPNVPAEAEDEESRSIISRQPGQLLDVLPPIISLFLENITNDAMKMKRSNSFCLTS